jgi:hypothetical protein
MRRYDPDWLADGRSDRRRYPIYLIVFFWVSVAACLIGVVGLAVSFLIVNRVFAATLFLVLAAGLGSVALVREKATTASVR